MPNTESSNISAPSVTSYWYNASSQLTKKVTSSIFFNDARLASNGKTPFIVKQIGAYVSGYGGLSRTCSFFLYGSGGAYGTGTFTVIDSTRASYTGLKNLSSGVYFDTGNADGLLEINLGGNSYIGTIPGDGVNPYLFLDGTTTEVDQVSSPKGLWAGISYAQVPSTPSLSISTNGSYGFSASWTTPDWGDTTTGRGYELYIKRGSTTVYSNTSISYNTNSLSISSGLAAATSYTAELYAKNELSTYSGSPRSVSSTRSFTTAAVAVPVWSGDLGNGRVGSFYSDSITASGATSVSRISGTVPPGLSQSTSSTSYSLSGVPTVSGTYPITVKATNVGGSENTTDSITIFAPTTPSWPDTIFKDGNAGQSYGSDSITASNADYVTATPSSIAGLDVSVSGSTVTLSGTPGVSEDGNYQINAIAYSVPDNGIRIQTPVTLSLTVNGIPRPTWQDTAIDELAAVNVPYSATISATNVISYSFVGAAPSWLSIGSSTGILSGTPTSADITYGLSNAQKAFIVSANGTNESVEQEFIIDVIHPLKVFKTTEGDFVYPSSQVERYDATLEDFVPVQNIRRRNDANTAWEDIDLN